MPVRIVNIALGAAVGCALALLVAALGAVILCVSTISEEMVLGWLKAGQGMIFLAAGFTAAKIRARQGLYSGLITGVVLAALFWLLALGLGCPAVQWLKPTRILWLLAAAAGGMLGVYNSK